LPGAIASSSGLWLFFTAHADRSRGTGDVEQPLAAQLVGINTKFVMTLSFALSAGIGALAGVLVTPITN
jgi:branched-chain amino acid transport system permease protein